MFGASVREFFFGSLPEQISSDGLLKNFDSGIDTKIRKIFAYHPSKLI